VVVTELVILVKAIVLQNEEKHLFWLDSVNECQCSVVYLDYCSKWYLLLWLHNGFCLTRFISFLIIPFLSLMQSAHSIICSNSSSFGSNFCQYAVSYICPHNKYLRGMRCELAGQAYGDIWVWDTKEWCLVEMGVSMKVVHMDWQYCCVSCNIKVLLAM
jgi:hypothetical protein